MPLKLKHKYLVLICLLISAGFAPYCFTVTRCVAGGPKVVLTDLPKQIGQWHMTSQNVKASPFEKSFLNDVLFRCYERNDGNVIALTVAYGADQRQNFSIHVPEGCYRASGYDVTSLGISHLCQPNLLLKQLIAQKGEVTEWIQYWIVLNGKIVTNHYERKIKQFYYSLIGARAGGILVRVSSLSLANEGQNFAEQGEFVKALYREVNPELKKLLFGSTLHER